MSKRPTTSDMEADVLSPQKSAAVAHGDDTVPLKAGTTKKADAANGDVDMGEFEDAWDDELVSEDEGDVVDCASESDEDEAGNGMAVDDEDQGDDEEDKEPEVKVYLPGQALAADEQLEVDNSAYMMLHDLKVEWPCLSFDFVGYGAD
ncbi:Ribosome assembly protein rrb1, partial [Dimargaris cristalligena]